ncbi:MAG: hypothetical protein K2X47_17665 [Bdellovibrionales bacterium]|nr:hypothetical protein [Bdellovibrionales bacterium]
MSVVFLLGKDSLAEEFSAEHRRKATSLSPVEQLVAESKDTILTHESLLKLHDLTFESAEFPYGKVDRFTKIGPVLTDQKEIQRFSDMATLILPSILEIDFFSKIFAAFVNGIIPIETADKESQRNRSGNGKSAHWLKGGIFLSRPLTHQNPELELTLNLAHELGHQVLMIYQDCDPLINNGTSHLVYSSIRKTLRPAIMSLHALIANYFMIRFIDFRLLQEIKPSEETFYLRRRISLFHYFCLGSYALKNASWTDFGRQLFLEMVTEISSHCRLS